MHRKFLRDSLICIIPCLIAAIVVFRAWQKYDAGEGGFKLGIDLVGGTILVYEVDQQREKERQALSKGSDSGAFQGEKTSQKLAEAIKRRIDPDDVKNIIVRPAGDYRIEVILPTGSHRKNVQGKKNVTSAEVDKIKMLIEDVGSLEFRIVANQHDDGPAFTANQDSFNEPVLDAKLVEIAWRQVRNPSSVTDEERNLIKDEPKISAMISSAVRGAMPTVVNAPGDEPWMVHGSKARYAWVEIGPIARADLGLLNKYDPEDPKHAEFEQSVKDGKASKNEQQQFGMGFWKIMAQARTTNSVVRHSMGSNQYLFYSRPCVNSSLSIEERNKRKYEYFVLTRISDRVEVDGTHVTITARSEIDPSNFQPIVSFTFNTAGGEQFGKVTRANLPDQDGKIERQLAIILNGKLISYPSIKSAISDRGQISGGFDQDYVNLIVQQLRSGALPATLKQKPVAENTIGPTLGADTITSGTRAIGAAYLAVLIFMLFYYRFAGMVACIALLANLLLTIAFMVAVDATFTLPGLAGLVLMLGMAVDANILIYERLREERDRGANLLMAIRNAYDRAFGTIIDTHLTSIFTALVLYAVGNDQLRGFGISLAVGLVISLFTSLFMTHLLFDYWLKRNWLTKLRMLRFFSRPSIDFMRLRKVMFPITAALTVLGLAVFLLRGDKSLNVDFIGGTVYGGQLNREVDIETLRGRLKEERQRDELQVTDVKKIEEPGKDAYMITYVKDAPRRIDLALGIEGDTPEEKIENLKRRASTLPDLAIEQNFRSGATGETSPYFTIRTTEKEPELVQAAIDKLFRDDNGDSMLAQIVMTVTMKNDDTWILTFSDPKSGEARFASEAFVRTLLNREFAKVIPENLKGIEPYQLQLNEEQGKVLDGRHTEMTLTRTQEAKDNLSAVLSPKAIDDLLKRVASDYSRRPQPERLEVFDPALAGETRSRALVAILISWLAILLYLWFRFGNWTFGLAAVLCLIHDLCFTIGAIAFCHYIHDTTIGRSLGLQDFKIDFAAVAALLTLVGYSVNEIIVNFARVREVRGKNPLLTPQMINDSINQTISRTVLTAATTWLVSMVLFAFGGSGVHLFAFVMVVGVMIATYSSIYVACPLLLLFGEGRPEKRVGESRAPVPVAPQPKASPVTA
jgi:SecD/SecF fusion protein